MNKWVKAGKTVNAQGMTITYRLEETDVLVQSRRRHIPHANGSGWWEHTSYWVINKGEEIKEFMRRADAEKYAERLERGDAP